MGKVKSKAIDASSVCCERGSVTDYLVSLGNPRSMAALYADAFVEWQESVANITKNGSVVANPRTGAPIDNPYLKVRNGAQARLLDLQRVKTGGLWDCDWSKADAKTED